MAFNQTWNDAFEDVPADADQIKFGADKIRDLKEGMRERLQVDHEVATADGSGTDTGVDTGYHKSVTLKTSTPGTAPTGYVKLGGAANVVYYKGVNGILRTIVNTNESQTLSSKTLASPTLSGTSTIATANIVGGHITTLDAAMNCASKAMTNVNIDSGRIDNTPIAGSTGAFTSGYITTLSSAMNCASKAMTNVNIDSGSISGVTGSFTTLAASGLASLTAGVNTGVGTLKWKIYNASSGTLSWYSLPTQTIAHGLSNTMGVGSPVVIGAFYCAAQRDSDSPVIYDWVYGFADVNKTNIIFTPQKGLDLNPHINWDYYYNVVIFYRG